MSTDVLIQPARRRAALVDLLPGTWLRDIAVVLAGAGLVAGLGQVAIPLGFTPVPLSLGTLAVLSVGAALGPARALASLSLFALVGIAGAPVFVGGGHGLGGPSFGYVLGYILAAPLVGWLARRGGDRTVWVTVGTMLLGNLVIYAGGVPWLAHHLGVSLSQALAVGVAPFLLGDGLKTVLAAALFPSAWAIVSRQSRIGQR